MPGTIHVSVLDFSGLPSTSSSPVPFKVSLGKREYQTLDKGDFSFPVKSLREKLVLVVLDDVGNEFRQTVVEAILIVQKGQWDDYFHFNGGGRVRMRLQFILSDDDRVKIRKMRDSALQKKRSQLLITHPELRKTISLDAGVRSNENSVDILSQLNDGNEASKTSPVNDSVSFINTQLSVHDNKGVAMINEKTYPNDMERAEEAMNRSTVSDAATSRSGEVSTTTLVPNQEAGKQYLDKSPGVLNLKPSTFGSKGKLFSPTVDDQEATTLKEGKLRKTPSSVRNMISAFECNTTQDTESRNKPPLLKAPIVKLGFDNPSHELVADEVVVAAAAKKLAEMSSEIVVSPSFFSELRQKVSAKKRQISYDVVEIITIAPERDLTEVGTVDGTYELVTELPGNETCASAVGAMEAVDRFDVMTEDVRICDMASGEDEKTVPTVEIRDNVESQDMEIENKDKPLFDDRVILLTLEKNGIDRPEADSDIKCYDPPQEQIKNFDDETENSISADSRLAVTKDDNSDLENDHAATVHGVPTDTYSAKQMLFDHRQPDNLNSGGRIMEVISEKKLPSEDPKHINNGTTHSTKLNNTKSLVEWSPTGEPPRSWVFPDESRASCVAPNIMQLTNSIGGSKVEATNKAVKDDWHSSRKPLQDRKPVYESSRSCGANDSAGDGNHRGQFAQAIKIAIMVAFGALVFFSRQRNHR